VAYWISNESAINKSFAKCGLILSKDGTDA
jgi:hypothetical protein